MSTQTSRFDEIIVRIVPTPVNPLTEALESANRQTRFDPTRSYDALVYAEPGITLPDQTASVTLTPGQPSDLSGLPIRAVERIVVRWGRYEDYLGSFYLGVKGPYMMRERLIETLSPGLETLFANEPLGNKPVRVWWNSQAPELDELPWELVMNPSARSQPGLVFVRGLPPSPPPPLLPLDGPLRLALITGSSGIPGDLLSNLETAVGVQLIVMPGNPRDALTEAVRQGYELLHIVADGFGTQAFEGVLYFHGERAPELTSSELSAALRGSRIAVLGLTSAPSQSPDEVQIGRQMVPSVYRAFAYLGSTDLPMASVVAPLGPTEAARCDDFWHHFYAALSETLSIEDAVERGRVSKSVSWSVPPAPMALFLRHLHGRVFRRSTEMASAPNEGEAALDLSRQLVTKLSAVADEFDLGALTPRLRAFIEHETRNQQAIADDLAPWTALEANEA